MFLKNISSIQNVFFLKKKLSICEKLKNHLLFFKMHCDFFKTLLGKIFLLKVF